MQKRPDKYKYYFSNRLKGQLNQISDYPLTIVEAPSGFGKTTAVREYLKSMLPHAVCEYWYTCLGEPASITWIGVSELFSNINAKVADELKNIKMPTVDTVFYMTAILRNLNCQKETYLVIDNGQLINCDISHELMNVFSMHGDPKLHMIFITQQLDSRKLLSIHNDNIYTIETSDFFFDKEGISSLFHMEDLRFTEDELDEIYSSTEGWISAIRLQMINFKETGSFIYSARIEQLVETAIWNRLNPLEQDFLLKVSVFDSFTARQAAEMLEYDVAPDKIERDLWTSDFIRYFPDKRLFIIHSILLDYLRNRFYHFQAEGYQNKVIYMAGVSCAAMKRYCLAAEFFYKVKDFDAILSLPFTQRYLDKQKEKCEGKFLEEIFTKCPEDTLCKYPLTMITFGHYALLIGKYDLYNKLCGLIECAAQRETDFTEAEIRKIRGEYILLKSLGEFNDITKMHEGLKAAWEIFKGSSDLIEDSTPWLSVFPTAFGMFWRESGNLDRTLKVIDEMKPLYRKFSRGQAAGLNYITRSEVMLARGEDNEAEILSHKAIYEARSYKQDNICLYAELNLARIFILRGDIESFFTAIKNIKGYAKDSSDISIHRMVDLCISIISLILGIKDDVAPWLYDIEGIKKSLYAPVVPFAQILHLRILLIEKRYNELYAISQIALDTIDNPEGNMRYLMSKTYFLIFLAVAKYNNGNIMEAMGYLKEALTIALPDQIYLPFADHICMAELLSGPGLHCFNSTMSMDKNSAMMANSLSDLINLCKRQTNGVRIIRKAMQQSKSPLTPREREVAQLARDRLTAKEISAKLHIAETTVRTIMRSIYEKLDIHSKRELVSKEF